MSSPTSAQNVAKYFILKSAENKRLITNKKLQKLVYYAEVWYLVSNKGREKLYPDKIEAWIHGPVIPNLYHKYKVFGFGPISTKLGGKDDISGDIKTLLDEVWEKYGQLDADSLEALAHSEDPWINARKVLDTDEFGDLEIKDEAIVSYYSSVKNRQILSV